MGFGLQNGGVPDLYSTPEEEAYGQFGARPIEGLNVVANYLTAAGREVAVQVVLLVTGEAAIHYAIRGVRYVIIARNAAIARRAAATLEKALESGLAGEMAAQEAQSAVIEAELVASGQITAMAGQTAANARVLARALEAAGEVRGAGEAAHHIVASTAQAAVKSRAILQQFGIGVNEAVNGVFLGAEHASIHTAKYFAAVESELAVATTRDQAIAILKSIGARIANGTFPH